MPLQPNGGKLLMPVGSEKDVQAFYEQALELSQTAGRLTKPLYQADIRDHLYYIGALCPQYFRPLQGEVINLSGELRKQERMSIPISSLHTHTAL